MHHSISKQSSFLRRLHSENISRIQNLRTDNKWNQHCLSGRDWFIRGCSLNFVFRAAWVEIENWSNWIHKLWIIRRALLEGILRTTDIYKYAPKPWNINQFLPNTPASFGKSLYIQNYCSLFNVFHVSIFHGFAENCSAGPFHSMMFMYIILWSS